MKKMKRWDYSLEGKTCPTCHGTTTIEMQRDMHNSAGIVPCPNGYFRGHGYPTCVHGKLKFSKYDRDNETELKKRYAS